MLAQLSDPHLRVGPDDQGSAAALAAAVDCVLALRPPPDAVLVSGDIANDGRPEEYALAREQLARLPMPVHLLSGNHDDLPAPNAYVERVGELRLVACDTHVAGQDGGALDVAWLAARLAEDTETPTIVAMHHPPVLIGLPWVDAIGLPAADRAALAELLSASPHVRAVVAGHVHRTVVATLAGCPVLTCPSTNVQARLELGATEPSLVNEPPAILVHALVDGELVTHVQPTTP